MERVDIYLAQQDFWADCYPPICWLGSSDLRRTPWFGKPFITSYYTLRWVR